MQTHSMYYSLGLIGLGRMGMNMLKRLQDHGIKGIGYDANTEACQQANKHVIPTASSVEALLAELPAPRALWLMVPSGVVDKLVEELAGKLAPGDVIIDGGNSHYVNDIRHSNQLAAKQIDFMDVGVSGGVWGAERGYCQMIGGPENVYQRLEPVFSALAPGFDAAPRTPERKGDVSPAEKGYLYCGQSGAGHFVKMVHNGIEYGLMAAYAEGFNLLEHANIGKQTREQDAETTPLEQPEHYQYDLPLPDIAEVWRRGSVVGSWLLDLTASEMHTHPGLDNYSGRVSDSGEGRWTALAAVEEGVPTPVLTAALYSRFSSRQRDLFANKVQSAMRHAFGGHHEKKDS